MGLGIEVLGADDGGLIGAAPDWLKKAGQAIVPAAASAAEDALKDKPKDGSKPGDKAKGGDAPSGGGSGESFFTKVLFWKVRVWHAMLSVAGAGGLAYWKFKK